MDMQKDIEIATNEIVHTYDKLLEKYFLNVVNKKISVVGDFWENDTPFPRSIGDILTAEDIRKVTVSVIDDFTNLKIDLIILQHFCSRLFFINAKYRQKEVDTRERQSDYLVDFLDLDFCYDLGTIDQDERNNAFSKISLALDNVIDFYNKNKQ